MNIVILRPGVMIQNIVDFTKDSVVKRSEKNHRRGLKTICRSSNFDFDSKSKCYGKPEYASIDPARERASTAHHVRIYTPYIPKKSFCSCNIYVVK